LYNGAKSWLGFKQGGVVSFTGPAWLDGTSSAPEMVLNQSQTKDILSLVDYLNSDQGEELGKRIPPLGRLGKSIPKLNKYKKGGLVQSTGLAWLDGTSNRPEYVLNAKQTEGYLELQKLLAGNNSKKLTLPQNRPNSKENNLFDQLLDTFSFGALGE
jgi:hypothetical protein